MRRIPILVLGWFLIAPSFTAGAVVIQEIAWMGDSDSANHEWIELHNTGSTAVDMAGWELRDSGNLHLDLEGIIEPGAYVVLERNRSSENYLFNPPFLIYTGALVNTGATLSLYQADGTIIDQVAGGENWQNAGGDNTTKETAQLSRDGWITAPATPGAATVVAANAVSTAATKNPPVATSDAVILTGSETTVSRKQSSPEVTDRLRLSIRTPAAVYVGQPTTFSVSATGVIPVINNSLTYTWNLGDTHTAESDTVTHTYSFPGQYVVSVRAVYATHEATTRQTITVLPITLSLNQAASGAVHIHNDSPYEVDISGYRLVGARQVVFPPRSAIVPHGTITVDWEQVVTNPSDLMTLFDNNSLFVSHTALASTDESVRQPLSAGPPVVPPVEKPAQLPSPRFSFASATTASTVVPSMLPATSTDISPPANLVQTAATTSNLATAAQVRSSSWATGALVCLLMLVSGGLWWHRRISQVHAQPKETAE